MSNTIIVSAIQWFFIFLLLISVVIKNRQLDKLSDKLYDERKSLKAATSALNDLTNAIADYRREADNYKRLCSSSDSARRDVMARQGIIACCDCKHLVKLNDRSYVCSCHGGMSHINDPQNCFCSLAAKEARENG